MDDEVSQLARQLLESGLTCLSERVERMNESPPAVVVSDAHRLQYIGLALCLQVTQKWRDSFAGNSVLLSAECVAHRSSPNRTKH